MTIQPIIAGRYQIEELLGQGGMAQVYRATDQVLQREVAVKVLAGLLASDPSYVTKFRREAQAAAGLNHPGIVRVFDSGTEGDTHYIVMERVLGSTLQQVMTTQGTLPLDRIVEIACSVAEALSYAHGNGLVHRDVKPGNIMIDDAGGVRISDFGIARTASQTLTLTGTVLGTATSQTVLAVIGSIRERKPAAGLDAIHRALDSGADPRSLARQIVEGHGGRIEAKNRPGGGAVFRVSIPRPEGR